MFYYKKDLLDSTIILKKKIKPKRDFAITSNNKVILPRFVDSRYKTFITIYKKDYCNAMGRI
jgi:hypothetical protein